MGEIPRDKPSEDSAGNTDAAADASPLLSYTCEVRTLTLRDWADFLNLTSRETKTALTLMRGMGTSFSHQILNKRWKSEQCMPCSEKGSPAGERRTHLPLNLTLSTTASWRSHSAMLVPPYLLHSSHFFITFESEKTP